MSQILLVNIFCCPVLNILWLNIVQMSPFLTATTCLNKKVMYKLDWVSLIWAHEPVQDFQLQEYCLLAELYKDSLVVIQFL